MPLASAGLPSWVRLVNVVAATTNRADNQNEVETSESFLRDWRKKISMSYQKNNTT